MARKDGAEFICALWVHKAKELPKEQLKREVDWHLTGKETEAWEILYFKVYKSQLGVVEKALETAALMLGLRQIPRLLPRNDLRRFSSGSYARESAQQMNLDPTGTRPR